MDDAREKIKAGVEALARLRTAWNGVEEMLGTDELALADAFSAALSILKGEDHAAIERVRGLTCEEHDPSAGAHPPRRLRARGGGSDT